MTAIKPVIPDKIYLQIEYDGETFEDGWTWCADKVNESDIEYVQVKTVIQPTPAQAPNEV